MLIAIISTFVSMLLVCLFLISLIRLIEELDEYKWVEAFKSLIFLVIIYWLASSIVFNLVTSKGS